MSSLSAPVSTRPAASRPRLSVDATTRQKPAIVDLLGDWQYVERSMHRLICAWGREIAPWDDKSAIHRHVWDQAECVRRLRERIAQFPGGKPDAPVSARLEHLASAILLAPGLEDALDGIYQCLLKTLTAAYGEYSTHAHPIHDAPTVALLHEINQIKSQQWLWYRDWRRRHPHVTDATYRAAVESQLAACGHLREPLKIGAEGHARPAGVGTDFRLARFSRRDQPLRSQQPFMDYVRADFRTSLETRRLFWAYGYMLEKNLPDDQLRWLYDGHYMPWDWHHDISRHLWDESRHGDSGYSRLRDFNISLEEVGFPGYDNAEREALLQQIAAERGLSLDECFAHHDELLSSYRAEPITKAELYQHVFMIGLIAETGHFVVKNESYVDFKEGQDLESAEMMLFDIIDETAHVQYAHHWLPLLAEHAGIDNADYRERAARLREEYQSKADQGAAALQSSLPRTPGSPAYDFYQSLLTRIRAFHPLSNAATCPPRSGKPM